ncbi:NADH dehydrogenase [Verrucomicrobium sp. GAS474]|uniref:complex I NDUFA9 subunit family protein n=1 Tax=Verrucomicrobium sp. GAS474 TaxID=1882831 RepID=UPI00087D6E62|nr:complex I NDUFA9 subunit family protein [Verrucomicrobium sp. GAS474]SDU30444.1 NADH dehydrogenase [Verrucomicrobium sp. GAS474]
MSLILVTGGTGFVGREVVRELAARGYTIRLLCRDAVKGKGLPWLRALAKGNHGQIEVVSGDILDPASLPAACAGVDTVVHLVGIIAERGTHTFRRVHAEGTANLVRAARQADVHRFVHMSALGTKPGARSPYHATKWEGEESVRNGSGGMVWTIFRPSVIFGPRDRFANRLAAFLRPPLSLLQLNTFPLFGGGHSRLQPVSVDDVAKAFVAAIPHADAAGKTYDLVGPEPLTLRELLRVIVEVQGSHILFFPLPWPLAFLAGALLEKLPDPPVTVAQVTMLRDDNVGDPAPAAAAFGLKQASFRQGIAKYLSKAS